MARKGMQLDAALLSDMHAVGADSFRDQIVMIPVEKIKPSLNNFYSINDIALLAEDIQRQGLKHNLVVTADAEHPDTYFIKSGHRRFEAIKLLAKMNLYTSNYVPCLVDGEKTEAENMFDLIMLNATTRVMTDAEQYQQYEILKDTIEQLKAEGKKVEGRLREHVAAFLKISPAQVGKIENIKHNAAPEVQEAVENGTLSITTANDIARLPEEQQRELIEENNLSEIRSKDVKKYQSVKPSDKDLDVDEPEQLEPVDDDSVADEPEQYEPVDTDPDEEESEQDDSVEDISDGDEPEQDEPVNTDLDEDEPEQDNSEETQCEHYRAAILDCIQRAMNTINAANTMKSIDRAVVQLQSELRTLMEEI